MRTRKGFTLIELLVVIAIIAVLAAILFPVFARARRAAQASNCQSNMKQIGNAIKMYLSDWDDTYMTNRNKVSGGGLSNIMASVALSPPDPIGTETEPRRFQYSINWIEGLYSYVETITKSSDPQSVWRCTAASNSTWPTPNPTTGYPYPAVNYVFNYNLIEQPEGIIKAAANLLMVREFWQTTIAELRPSNGTAGNSGVRPQYPFLNGDLRAISGNSDRACKLHSNGSHILFTDGHVKIFDLTFMPKYADITAGNCWDEETQQWYNFAPASGKRATYIRSIAITP